MRKVIVFGLSDSVGGVENYLLGMQKQLMGKVQFVYFVESRQNMHEETVREQKGKIVFIPREDGLKAYTNRMRKMLSKYRNVTDIIYLNISNYSHERLLVLMLANLFKYRVIVHSHAAKLKDIDSKFHQITHQIIKNVSLTYTRKCKRLAVSQRAGHFLYGKQSFGVLSAGIDLNRFSFDKQLRDEMRIGLNCEDKYVVGFVGRMVDVKNPKFAIRVIKELGNLIGKGNVLLLMVGGGELLDDLTAYVINKKLEEEVLFVGETNQVYKYLQAMDCLIGTSLSEGMPLGIMEAQAAGLPCICADGRYPNEIVVTKYVRMIPLEKGEAEWAQTISQLWRKHDWEDCQNRITNDQALEAFDQSCAAQKLYKYLTTEGEQ